MPYIFFEKTVKINKSILFIYLPPTKKKSKDALVFNKQIN